MIATTTDPVHPHRQPVDSTTGQTLGVMLAIMVLSVVLLALRERQYDHPPGPPPRSH